MDAAVWVFIAYGICLYSKESATFGQNSEKDFDNHLNIWFSNITIGEIETSVPIGAWKWNFPSILENYDRPIDQQTDQKTDMRVKQITGGFVMITHCFHYIIGPPLRQKKRCQKIVPLFITFNHLKNGFADQKIYFHMLCFDF